MSINLPQRPILDSTSTFTAHTRGARIAIAIIAIGLTLGLLASPAQATTDSMRPVAASGISTASGDPLVTSYTHSNVSGGAWLRAGSKTTSTGLRYLYNDTEVVMMCWTDSESVSPPNSNYTSKRWFKVNPTYTVDVGYVHSSFVYRQITVPRC